MPNKQKKWALILAILLSGCLHNWGAPAGERTVERLALDYVSLVDGMDREQASAVMGCLPARWANLDSASAMLAEMRMDDAAAVAIRRDEMTAMCRSGSPALDCCVMAYYTALTGADYHALRTYKSSCEPVGGTGYVGCLPLIALWPHITETRPDWLPPLSERDRVEIAAWAIAKARADRTNDTERDNDTEPAAPPGMPQGAQPPP
jgi:hypothetical protein